MINKDLFNLCLSIAKERGDFFPEEKNILRSLELASKPKVIILGQDPYHGKDEANGLAFAVNMGVKTPPSLKNIFKELKNDLNIEANGTTLEGWARQGVLLLNTVLTVSPNKPGSHFDIGWELFTDNIIESLGKEGNKVFILWGKKAQTKKRLINIENNYIIESNHPSPLSANRGGFFGSKPFSKTNDWLTSKELEPIDWSIID
jgi:uracil-DNA glycosylase